MKKLIVLFILFSAFTAANAQKNPLINPEIKSGIKHDSLRFFSDRWTGLFKSKIIPAQNLLSNNQLSFSKGTFFTYDTIQKPTKINLYTYGNLKPILSQDLDAFPLYKRARITRYVSNGFILAEFTFFYLGVSNQLKVYNGKKLPDTRTKVGEFDYKSEQYINAAFGSLLLSVGTGYLSRHYLNKSVKKFNQNAFPY